MSLATILPLAFVMIAGPQIISAFFFATSKDWVRSSLAYVVGAAISITTFVSIAYLIGQGSKNAASEGSSTVDTVLDWVILALIVAASVHVFATRRTSHPPKWMGELQEASPRFALVLGLLLLGVFPTDILTSIAAGLHVARHDDSWWQCLPFVAVTLLLLGLPALTVAAIGPRAQNALPKIRDWMNQNSWVVSEIVLVFFAVITINSLVGG